MTRRAVLPIVVAAAALALPASSLAASGAAPQSAWARSADALCASFNKKVSAIPEPKTMKELATGTEQILALGIAQTRAIGGIPRAGADKAAIATLLGYFDQQVAIVKRLIVAIKANDQKKSQAIIAEGNTVNAKISAVEKKLGATGCAS